MPQYDVCELKPPKTGYVVVLQHDVSDQLDTVVVAPLSDAPYRQLIDRLRLQIDFSGRPFILQTDRLAAIPRGAVGHTVGTLKHDQDRIKLALDFLFFGF